MGQKEKLMQLSFGAEMSFRVSQIESAGGWAFVSLFQHIIGCGMPSGNWGNFGQGDFGD